MDHSPTVTADPPHRPSVVVRSLVLVAVAVFATFWIWALFFASKEAVNRINDRAWGERAEVICTNASAEREALADYRRLDADDPDMLRERADLIDRSTDVVEAMLDDVTAVAPTDEKGAAIVPQWESEYRDYIQSRRTYADVVRNGSNEPFREPDGGGIPISDRLSVFATDNGMPTCSPPNDL